MNESLYSYYFNKALASIKQIRDPRATRPETVDLRWNDVESQVLFDFVGNDLETSYHISHSANDISISCVCLIIYNLFMSKEKDVDLVDVSELQGFSKSELGLLKKSTQTLLLFKQISQQPFWKSKNSEPNDVKKIMAEIGAKKCEYYYLVFDNAYLQVIGHDENENDPGRGYNIYSLKCLFEKYFSDEEYKVFKRELTNYVESVKKHLGYAVIKTLNPASFLNFQKILEYKILSYPYDNILEREKNGVRISKSGYEKIKGQFINSNAYRGLLGCGDFAESLITAEWLADSMRKAETIDLTPIVMGYFKAAEQLLFDLICLHKDEGRTIKERNGKDYIDFNDHNIKEKRVDSTIGSIAYFFKNNTDILRNELDADTLDFVVQSIFEYKKDRNGYSHKDNIHDFVIIERIRSITFELMFLLLGSFRFSKNNLMQLGYPLLEASDYYKLCEYINFHYGEPFFVEIEEDKERILLAYCDEKSKLIDDKYIGYTGAYFKELGENGRICLISKEHPPRKIIRGKFVFKSTEEGALSIIKLYPVFEGGKFVGPLIAAEDNLNY